MNTVSADNNLIDRIESLEEDKVLIIETRLIPPNYFTQRKFLKHGQEVKPERVYTLEQMAKEIFVPVRLREEAFNSIADGPYCGYSFIPLVGRDKRKRKVSLVECLEGARLFAYAHKVGTGIEFKSYEDSKKVESEGAEITVRVPSRTQKRSRYEFNLISVPIVDNRDKFAITQSIASTGHDCKRKQYDFRFKYEDEKESSRLFNFCAHEIAAYFEVANYSWNILKNIIPLEMNQFAIPTGKTVEYYKRLCDSTLIRDNNLKTKDKLRKLNKADKEILLWGFVHRYKHNETFFARERIENYDWQLRGRN